MKILDKFQITNHSKYLLYLAGILLILSFSVNIKIISNLKLAILSLITILYGLSCWIYDINMNNFCDNVNVAWQFELTKPTKTGERLNKILNGEDPHKEFLEKYDPIKLSKRYQHTKIIMFVIYVILLLLGIIFIA